VAHSTRHLARGVLLPLLACSDASATFIGDRYFVSTLVTTVPTPSDFANVPHFVMLPETADGTKEADFLFTWSKLITKDWSLFATGTFRILDEPNVGVHTGFANSTLGTQYQAYANEEHQFVLTVGGTATIEDTGTPGIDAEFSTVTPTLYWGKGFGDLPDSLAWLQPVTITGNLSVTFPLEDTFTDGTEVTNPDILNWSFALEYTLLDTVHTNGRRYPVGVVPLVELAFTTPLDGPDEGETTGTINPGIILVQKEFQFALEAIIPINEDTDTLGFRAQIHWYLGNIFPDSFLGKPIFE
jgi:hypothetical protein